MENRIEKKFKELKAKRKKAFVAFVTAGDPNLKKTEAVIDALENAGVDIIELGVPFSDPMADGPVIQKSGERALKSGTSLKGILALVKKIRRRSQVPILLMGYYNPVFHYGEEKFYRDAKQAGVDGALWVDLPPEAGESARRAAVKHDIAQIFLLAPTSDQRRVEVVKKRGKGFIYYVAVTGITGATLKTQLSSHQALKRLLKGRSVPVCVGFGVKTPEQASQVAKLADGVVVGTAFVRLFEEHPFPKALSQLKSLASRIGRAVHAA